MVMAILDSLRRRIVLLNITIDKGGKITSRSRRLICSFRNSKRAQELVERLGRFLVFGFGILCV